jgi:PilZ domain-containing protein
MSGNRQATRYHLGRVATITFGQGEQLSCLVQDFSADGLRLRADGFEIPDEFVLLSPPGGPTRKGNYQVVWRLGQEVGAKFVDPAEK